MKKIILLLFTNTFLLWAIVEENLETTFSADQMLEASKPTIRLGVDAINKAKGEVLDTQNSTIEEKKVKNRLQYELDRKQKINGVGPLVIKNEDGSTNVATIEEKAFLIEKKSPIKLLVICFAILLIMIVVLKIKKDEKGAV